MAFIDDAKKHLRISTDLLDVEVQDLIDAAKADLQLSGIPEQNVDETDPLIKRAIVVYCKANFGYDNPDADRLHASYDMLKKHLTLAGDYNAVE